MIWGGYRKGTLSWAFYKLHKNITHHRHHYVTFYKQFIIHSKIAAILSWKSSAFIGPIKIMRSSLSNRLHPCLLSLQRGQQLFSTTKSIFPSTSLTVAAKTRSVAEDTFEGFVTDRWSVGEAPNGGFLMMMALDSASQCTSHPDPLSCTTTFLSKADENEPVLLQVRRMMQSKSMAIMNITMRQKNIVRSEHTAIFGTLSDNIAARNDGFDHSVKVPVHLPPRSECIHASPGWRKHFGRSLNIVAQTEAYIAPDSPAVKGILRGKTTDHASITTYLGLSNREIPSLMSLAFFNDAMFPPVLNVATLGWVPTLQYSVHFWNRPPVPAHINTKTQEQPPLIITDDKEPVVHDECFVRCRFETDYVRNSWLYTDGEIWSHDGSTLLATSRQLARLLSPKASANNFTKP